MASQAEARMKRSQNRFNKAVIKFEKKTMPRELVLLHKKLGFDGLRMIVDATPVRLGRAKGNWQVGVNQRIEDTIERLDKNGGETITAGLAAMQELKPFQFISIANNLPYIIPLEGGSSSQGGNMVAMAFENLKAAFP